MSTILGVDHGTRTGFTILQNGMIKKISYFNTNKRPNSANGELFNNFYNNLEEIIKEYKPELICMEQPMSMLNGKTTKMLIGYYSMIHILATRYKIQTYELYPTSVKKAVTGNGSASKEEVAIELAKHYNVDLNTISPPVYYKTKDKKHLVKSRFYDESDSLALATQGIDKLKLLKSLA